MLAFLLALTLAAPLHSQIVVGLASGDREIHALAGSDALDVTTGKHRVLILGGLDGSGPDMAVQRAWERFRGSKSYAITAIPAANPGRAKLVFPPVGEAYRDNTESHVLWRWIGVHAPDFVLIAGPDPANLAEALRTSDVAGIGRIPAAVVPATDSFLADWIARSPKGPGLSPARQEMQRRARRKPLETARRLGDRYGHDLPEAVYIPAVAVIGRIRLGHLADAERIAAPYATGAKNSLEKPTGSHHSGHLLFAELAARTGHDHYVQLVRRAADMAFAGSGQPLEAMPFHNEMSDSVFMATPILAAAGHLTKQDKYFDMAVRHFRFMRALDLRPDGLYRHSPLDDSAWGRGNGFPALGLAWTLRYLPPSHPGRAEILDAFRKHMAALLPHQDETGMWRQLIDVPGAYRELTATCMIATSMLQGIRAGWLDRKRYQPAVDRAWAAVNLRVSSDGSLIDVCTGTGKQKSRRDYLDRPAILGPDPRGGAMALLFATEMAGLR